MLAPSSVWLFRLLPNSVTSAETFSWVRKQGRISPYENTSKLSFQGGILAEYYFAKQWSLSARVKLLSTELSFNVPARQGQPIINLGSEASYGDFHATVISLPVNLAWQFRIFQQLLGRLSAGYSLNQELSSAYHNYSPNQRTDYSRFYGSPLAGLGLSYVLNGKTVVFSNVELSPEPERGRAPSLISNNEEKLRNTVISAGIKFLVK